MYWSVARSLAAQYQSSGWEGMGFATFASTGRNTNALWDNIRHIEAEAETGKPGTENWAADMARLRELLAADGITEPKFEAGDVVRFADGNGKMFLWGDHVDIDVMFVTGYDEQGRVTLSSDPYTFAFEEEKLVKVGEIYDTEYDSEGNEIYKWLPELNEPED